MKLPRLGLTWLTEHEVRRIGHMTPPWACVIIAVTYVVGFGLGVRTAFSYLLSSSARTQLQSATSERTRPQACD